MFTLICRQPRERRFEDIPIRHIGALVAQLLDIYGDVTIEIVPQAQASAPAQASTETKPKADHTVGYDRRKEDPKRRVADLYNEE